MGSEAVLYGPNACKPLGNTADKHIIETYY